VNAFYLDAWKWIAVACFAWYAAVTAWVAVRGFVDIRRMLARIAGHGDRTSGAGRDVGSDRDL